MTVRLYFLYPSYIYMHIESIFKKLEKTDNFIEILNFITKL